MKKRLTFVWSVLVLGKNKLRRTVQFIWTVVTNGNFNGFLNGTIYTGSSKHICVPGLNCYSCPGALGACPIGSLQAVIGSWKYKISYYVIGLLTLFGAIFGRIICGWLCPFGLIQDLLHKIPFPKKIKTFKWDKALRFLKYIILLIFVLLLPMFVVDIIGQGEPFFCKYICPSGTLLGGIPLVLSNKPLQDLVGWLFAWKSVILAVVVMLSIIIYRPFCKYICPLGAIYSFFNPISVNKLKIDKDKCVACGLCSKACEMNIEPFKTPNHLECIRCGECITACPCKAISFGVFSKNTCGGITKSDLKQNQTFKKI